MPIFELSRIHTIHGYSYTYTQHFRLHRKTSMSLLSVCSYFVSPFSMCIHFCFTLCIKSSSSLLTSAFTQIPLSMCTNDFLFILKNDLIIDHEKCKLTSNDLMFLTAKYAHKLIFYIFSISAVKFTVDRPSIILLSFHCGYDQSNSRRFFTNVDLIRMKFNTNY